MNYLHVGLLTYIYIYIYITFVGEGNSLYTSRKLIHMWESYMYTPFLSNNFLLHMYASFYAFILLWISCVPGCAISCLSCYIFVHFLINLLLRFQGEVVSGTFQSQYLGSFLQKNFRRKGPRCCDWFTIIHEFMSVIENCFGVSRFIWTMGGDVCSAPVTIQWLNQDELKLIYMYNSYSQCQR
jgi:hypothetical protein